MGYFGGKALINNIYTEKDMETKVEWISVDNSDRNLWDNFENSGIPQNDMNRQLYISEIIKRNGNNLEEKIEVPVLKK